MSTQQRASLEALTSTPAAPRPPTAVGKDARQAAGASSSMEGRLDTGDHNSRCTTRHGPISSQGGNAHARLEWHQETASQEVGTTASPADGASRAGSGWRAGRRVRQQRLGPARAATAPVAPPQPAVGRPAWRRSRPPAPAWAWSWSTAAAGRCTCSRRTSPTSRPVRVCGRLAGRPDQRHPQGGQRGDGVDAGDHQAWRQHHPGDL